TPRPDLAGGADGGGVLGARTDRGYRGQSRYGRSDGRAIRAQLAAIVATPAVDAAVLRQGQTVGPAGGQRSHGRQARHPMGNRLTATQAPNAAFVVEKQRVRPPTGRGSDRWRALQPRGPEHMGDGGHTDLAVLVRAPGPDPAVARDGDRMTGARGHGAHAGESFHAPERGVLLLRAVP